MLIYNKWGYEIRQGRSTAVDRARAQPVLADDDGRKRALTRKLNAEELKEDDFKVGGAGQ